MIVQKSPGTLPARQVFNTPAHSRLAAPPVYCPQQSTPHLHSAARAGLVQQHAVANPVYRSALPTAAHVRPAAPPVYRPPALGVTQGKTFGVACPPPIYRPVSQPGTVPPPVYHPYRPNVTQGKTAGTSSPPVYGPANPVRLAAPPVYQPYAHAIAQAKAIGVPNAAPVYGPQPHPSAFPAIDTVQTAKRKVSTRTAAKVGEAARRKAIGLNPRGTKIRKRRPVVRYDPSPEGRYGRVNFTFMGMTRKGLNPGSRHLQKTTITYTGTRAGDYAAAGGAAPIGQVWHHYHNYNPTTGRGTMYLMTVGDHAPAHSGGVWMYEQAHGVVYG